jgi:hypothetical protein
MVILSLQNSVRRQRCELSVSPHLNEPDRGSTRMRTMTRRRKRQIGSEEICRIGGPSLCLSQSTIVSISHRISSAAPLVEDDSLSSPVQVLRHRLGLLRPELCLPRQDLRGIIHGRVPALWLNNFRERRDESRTVSRVRCEPRPQVDLQPHPSSPQLLEQDQRDGTK